MMRLIEIESLEFLNFNYEYERVIQVAFWKVDNLSFVQFQY